jgi:hypothetical protein
MEKISVPVRIFLVLIVLAGAAGMLAMRTMGPSAEPVATPAPVAKTPAQTPATPKPTARKPAAKPTAAPAAKPAPAVNAPVVPATGFPKAVDLALRKNRVVVVSLVVPGARVDEIVAAEAQAGAKLGGAGFLALNVLDESVARALLTKIQSVQDPSVILVTRSGEIAQQLTGFIDRETVAQAAANASP